MKSLNYNKVVKIQKVSDYNRAHSGSRRMQFLDKMGYPRKTGFVASTRYGHHLAKTRYEAIRKAKLGVPF